jgi:hypothetical protein
MCLTHIKVVSYQSSDGEWGRVDRREQQLKIHKGAATWQQLQSAAVI